MLEQKITRQLQLSAQAITLLFSIKSSLIGPEVELADTKQVDKISCVLNNADTVVEYLEFIVKELENFQKLVIEGGK